MGTGACRLRAAGILLALLCVTGLGATPFQATGLVGHWKLDETGGTTANDSIGSLDGTYLGTSTSSTNVPPNLVNYPIGATRVFDGTNDEVTVTDTPALQITGDITIAFWMNKASEASDWQRLVGKGAGGPRNYGVWEETGAGQRILWQQYNAAGGAVLNFFSTATIPISAWRHVTCTLGGTAATIYVDAVASGTGTRTGTPVTSADPLTFGYAGFHTYFPGLLSDVRIYNRELTAAEVGILHAGLPGATGLTGTAPSFQQVDLTWNPPTSPATSYNVLRAAVAGGPYTSLATVTGTTYSDTSVGPGTGYFYRVTAMLSVGESAQSNTFNILTPPAPPRFNDHEEGLIDGKCNCASTGTPSRSGALAAAGLLLLALFLRRRA